MFIQHISTGYPIYILCLYRMYPLTCRSPPQADQKGGTGAVSMDLELLKQLRVAAVVASDRIKRSGAQDTVWLE